MTLVKIGFIEKEHYPALASALCARPDPTDKGKLIDLSKLSRDQLSLVLANDYIKEEELFALKAHITADAIDDPARWLSYWADVLRFSDLNTFAQQPALRAKWFQSYAVQIDEIEAGQLPLNEMRLAQPDWQALADLATDASVRLKDSPSRWVPVILTFGYEFPDKTNSNKYVQIVILAVPALFHLDTGHLGATAEAIIINSRHLSSADRDARVPRIGPLQQADCAESQIQDTYDPSEESPERTWAQHWERQNELFKTYQDTEPRSIRDFAWTKKDKPKQLSFLGVAAYTAIPVANKRLLKLIEDIQTQRPRAALFNRILDGDKFTDAARPLIDWQSNELVSARARHVGHMGGDFGLDPTQRLALWQTTTVNSGEVIAVSGPPGTGKTSMLQGFIAMLVVNAAINERPCVILAASQTNQATKNMIKAFRDIARPYAQGQQITVEHRWLQGFPSYGWFFPSASQRKKEQESPFQILYRPALFDTTLWAGGKAARADGKARAVSITSAQELHLYRNEFMRNYREYLQSIGESSKESPTVWLHRKIIDIAGVKEGAALHKATHCCNQIYAIFERYSLSEMKTASARSKWLARRLPADKREQIVQLVAEQAKAKALIAGLKRTSVAARRFPPQDWLQKAHALLTAIIPRWRQIQREKDERDFQDLMHTLLDAKPTMPLPADLQSMIDCVPGTIKEQQANIATLQEPMRRLLRRQDRLNHVKAAREAQQRALSDKVHALKELDLALVNLQSLFRTYRGEPCCAEFGAGLLNKPRVSGAAQKNTLFDLGESIRTIMLDAAAQNPRMQDLRQKLECVVDVTVRYHVFHLSMRYWESRWLDEVIKPLPINPKEEVRAVLERAAMLAPVIVATAQTMPGAALYLDANHVPTHLLGIGDWLIIDEAGQVAAPLSMPLTALARNALVVGDVNQLAPVVEIDRRANQDLRRRHGLGSETTEHRRINLDAVAGNMMACAQHAAARHEHAASSRYGVMLKYHYRCRQSIITFCNRLIYDAIDPLIPMVKDAQSFARTPQQATPEQALLPPMGFVIVQGTQHASGHSQCNRLEAEEIFAWLKRNHEAITARYGCLEDAVAVITPYTGQVALLQEGIKNLGIKVATKRPTLEDNEPGADVPKMVVDTVHALQGAEKDIVLFSPVNDGSGKPFIDSSPSMLNVAVSRAKHSFIVFGHPQVILQPGATPSGVLGSYLREFGYRLYPRDLVVLESASKVSLVEQAFGILAKGIATGGHFRELQFDENAKPTWSHTAKADALLTSLKSFVQYGERHYDTIVLATDDDREGEAIAWHVIDLVRSSGLTIPSERYKRLRFYAMNPQALIDGMKLCTNGVDPLRVTAALTRTIADAFIARQIRATAHIGAGRVSAALLDELDRLEQDRVSIRYRELATVRVDQETVQFVRLQDDQPLGDAANLTADHLVNVIPITASATPVLALGPVMRKEAAAAPTSTANVLRRAVNDLGLTPAQAMAALQEIYEGNKTSANAEPVGEQVA